MITDNMDIGQSHVQFVLLISSNQLSKKMVDRLIITTCAA